MSFFRNRTPVILTVLVFGAAIVTAGLWKLRLDPDILSTLPKDLPAVESLRLLRDSFAGADDLVLTVDAADAATAKAAAQTLAERLRSRAELCRQVQEGSVLESPETAGTLLAWVLQNGDPALLGGFQARMGDSAAVKKHLDKVLDELAASPDPAVVQRWQYDPLGLLGMVDLNRMTALGDSGLGTASADGTFRVLFVAPKEKPGGYREAEKWLAAVEQVIAGWRSSDASFAEVVIGRTGEPAFMAEIGGGIERDLGGTVGVGTVLIAALFWFMHRRWKPLFWILLLMVVSIGVSLSVAGLVVGKLTMMSLGFASIVLGIVVDYGVLILQEARDHPTLSARDVRMRAMPGILAGAATTSAVFFALLFIGMPGLAELGLLVGINVVTGAAVMLTCMPWLAVRRGLVDVPEVAAGRKPVTHRYALAGTLVLVIGVAGVLIWKGMPAFDGGAAALRPTRSEAARTWDTMQQRMGKEDEASVPLVLHAPAAEAGTVAAEAEKMLAAAQHEGLIKGHAIPAMFLPNQGHQAGNRPHLQWLVENQDRLEKAVMDEGFTDETLVLFNAVVDTWRQMLAGGENATRKPDPGKAGEVLRKFLYVNSDNEEVRLLGAVTLAGSPGNPDGERLGQLQERLATTKGVGLAAWETLGQALSARVQQDLKKEMLPLIAVLLVMLWIAYRNWKDLLLSVLLLGLGVLALMATMSALGKTWNLASLAALPLLLGTGIDYGIHTLLGMRREHNDIRRMRHTVGRAVFFCGATTVIGFMSLVVADNQGVASLGVACAAGTVWILLLVQWLLPHWRCWLSGKAGN